MLFLPQCCRNKLKLAAIPCLWSSCTHFLARLKESCDTNTYSAYNFDIETCFQVQSINTGHTYNLCTLGSSQKWGSVVLEMRHSRSNFWSFSIPIPRHLWTWDWPPSRCSKIWCQKELFSEEKRRDKESVSHRRGPYSFHWRLWTCNQLRKPREYIQHLLCHKQWQQQQHPDNTLVPNCGIFPVQLYPKFQTSPLHHSQPVFVWEMQHQLLTPAQHHQMHITTIQHKLPGTLMYQMTTICKHLVKHWTHCLCFSTVLEC